MLFAFEGVRVQGGKVAQGSLQQFRDVPQPVAALIMAETSAIRGRSLQLGCLKLMLRGQWRGSWRVCGGSS